jgi:hypothetical protein
MVVLHRLGIFSMGKVSGVYGALFGLLGGLFMSGMNLLSMIIGGAFRSTFSSHSSYGSSFDIIGIVTGLGAVICLPILYGVFGFIGGIISAFFINLALKIAGGLEMEATGFSLQSAPPPAAPRNITPLGPLPQ